ncbi:MAG: HPr kinase/phosphatase C-terminal domain-containing protein [Hyphomicrobiales bacterium]
MSSQIVQEVVHATCIAVGGKGILLLGPPGSGKSDLALRLIDTPGQGIGTAEFEAQLVADDQVKLTRVGNELQAAAPDALAGLLEVRGLGLVRVKNLASIRVDLCVKLRPHSEIERLPELAAQHYSALGLRLPLIEIDPTAASAPARVRAGVHHLFSP